MPTYDYLCPAGHLKESRESSETREIKCPVCGAPAERQMSAPRLFVFRGPGFYATDYGSGSSSSANASA